MQWCVPTAVSKKCSALQCFNYTVVYHMQCNVQEQCNALQCSVSNRNAVSISSVCLHSLLALHTSPCCWSHFSQKYRQYQNLHFHFFGRKNCLRCKCYERTEFRWQGYVLRSERKKSLIISLKFVLAKHHPKSWDQNSSCTYHTNL